MTRALRALAPSHELEAGTDAAAVAEGFAPVTALGGICEAADIDLATEPAFT